MTTRTTNNSNKNLYFLKTLLYNGFKYNNTNSLNPHPMQRIVLVANHKSRAQAQSSQNTSSKPDKDNSLPNKMENKTPTTNIYFVTKFNSLKAELSKTKKPEVETNSESFTDMVSTKSFNNSPFKLKKTNKSKYESNLQSAGSKSPTFTKRSTMKSTGLSSPSTSKFIQKSNIQKSMPNISLPNINFNTSK